MYIAEIPHIYAPPTHPVISHIPTTPVSACIISSATCMVSQQHGMTLITVPHRASQQHGMTLITVLYRASQQHGMTLLTVPHRASQQPIRTPRKRTSLLAPCPPCASPYRKLYHVTATRLGLSTDHRFSHFSISAPAGGTGEKWANFRVPRGTFLRYYRFDLGPCIRTGVGAEGCPFEI